MPNGSPFATTSSEVLTRYWDGKFRAHAEPGLVPGAPRHRGARAVQDHLQPVRRAGRCRGRRPPTATSSSSPARDVSAPLPGRSTDLASSPTATSPSTGTPDGRAWGVSGTASAFSRPRSPHEFSHTLGLHHVGGRGNADSNYGISLDQRNELMGMGDHADGEIGPALGNAVAPPS